MEREVSRVHKLAAPLILKRNGGALVISDGTFEHGFDFKDFGQITIMGSDSEGFITFEISKNQQPSLLIDFVQRTPSSVKRSSIGFSLIGRGTPKNPSSNPSRATYEYYKRIPDEYYSKIVLGAKNKKIHLGSLHEESSPIHKIISGIKHFGETQWFDRKMLVKHLEPAQRHGQKLKSTLDILTIEGYLERQESQKRGKPYEQYKKTSKMQILH